MTPADPLAGADLPAVTVDADAALDHTRARGGRRLRRRRAVLATAAVVAFVVVGAVAVTATRGRGSDHVVATGADQGRRNGVPGSRGPEVEPHTCEAPEGSPLDVAHEPGWRAYADYSDVTAEDGCLVRIDVLAERPGVDHCGWGSTRVLITGDPFGTRYSGSERSLHYVRDPDGVFGDPDLVGDFGPDVELPERAEPSGYFVEGRSVWVDPDDPSSVWVVTDGATIERWPRGQPPICN